MSPLCKLAPHSRFVFPPVQFSKEKYLLESPPEKLRKELEEELKLSAADIRSHGWYHGHIPREVKTHREGTLRNLCTGTCSESWLDVWEQMGGDTLPVNSTSQHIHWHTLRQTLQASIWNVKSVIFWYLSIKYTNEYLRTCVCVCRWNIFILKCSSLPLIEAQPDNKLTVMQHFKPSSESKPEYHK